jgi:RNA polymerase sigma factor (sigma-70 family)
LAPGTKQLFVASIEKAHSAQLRRFLSARLRNAASDIPDLVQEIYLRVLRLKDHEAIRNPQAYLYTIASHVLYQYALRRTIEPPTMDPLNVVDSLESGIAPDPAEEVDIEQRLQAMESGLEAHSPRAYAVLVMYRCEGLTLKQIGERLGVSNVMARKYLERAIKYCDQFLDRDRPRADRKEKEKP